MKSPNTSKRLLILSYHFPPLGGVAVQRMLRFSRYLPEFGWKPLVVCVQGGGAEPRDPQLLLELHPQTEVYRVPCLEPDNYSDSWEHPSQKVIRNLFKTFDFVLVPDDRALWVEPARRMATHLVRRLGVDAILATAQPWSTLVAAARTQSDTGIPLVLDFRDDWTTSNHDFRRRRPKRQAREEALEREVLERASAVISVTPPIVEQLRRRAPQGLPVHYLPNGFDPAHFAEESPEPGPGFTVLHAGIVHPQRPVAPFFKGVERWLERFPERRDQLHLRFPGRVAEASRPEFENWSFQPDCPGFLPHQQVRQEMRQADLLLLLLERVSTVEWLFSGKVFEYIGAGKPILMLGPTTGPLAELLQETGIGFVADHDDCQTIAEILEKIFQSGSRMTPRAAVVERFNARAQTQQLAFILDSMP